jgi:hypothetical protein
MVYVWPLYPSSYKVITITIVVINEVVRETSAVVT